MNQIATALAHYWGLRAQDIADAAARDHTFQRFGVRIDVTSVENAADDCEEIVRNPDMPWEGYGEGFRETTWGSSTGPQYGMPARHLACGGEYCEGDSDLCDGLECQK